MLDPKLKDSNPAAYAESMDILSYWRFSHEKPLDVAYTMLEVTAKKQDKSTIFAKRLKRYASIVAKLRRFKQMKLKNMQDIGGCRAIVSNEKKLRQLVRELRKRPEFKTSTGKIRAKDYIKTPKDDGYRGYHLIGIFGENPDDKKSIEIQIRTVVQHSWATALEIVDLFTGQALKSSLGDERWAKFFSLIGEQFSIMESINLFYKFDRRKQFEAYCEKILSDDKFMPKCRATQQSASDLNAIRCFEGFAQSIKILDQHLSHSPFEGYALIKVDTKKRQVEISNFSSDLISAAEEMYLKAEKSAAESKDLVVALVSTSAIGGLKEAYPNYFGDSTEFVNHLFMVTEVKFPRRDSLWGSIKNIFKNN